MNMAMVECSQGMWNDLLRCDSSFMLIGDCLNSEELHADIFRGGMSKVPATYFQMVPFLKNRGTMNMAKCQYLLSLSEAYTDVH